MELLRLSEHDVPCEVKSSLNLMKKSASQLLVCFENLMKKNNIVGFASVLVRYVRMMLYISGLFGLGNLFTLKD